MLFTTSNFHSLIPVIVASTTDNASVNDVSNWHLCRRLCQDTSRKLVAKDIQVECAAHITNLVVQVFLSGIGAAPDPNVEDWYEET